MCNLGTNQQQDNSPLDEDEKLSKSVSEAVKEADALWNLLCSLRDGE